MNTPRLTADARREQIIDVAVDVFGRAGYHGASMNDVAEAAGVTKPVLYQHFDSKHDLYRALIVEVGHRMLDAIISGQQDAANGRELTRDGFRAYFRWVAERSHEFSLLFGGTARNNSDFGAHIKRLLGQIADTIAPMIDAEVDPMSQRMLAHSLMGMAESASRYLVSTGEPFDPVQVADAVSGLAWAGLRAVDRTVGDSH